MPKRKINRRLIIMSKKVLLLCGDFTEDYETMVPFQSMSMLDFHNYVLLLVFLLYSYLYIFFHQMLLLLYMFYLQ